MAKIPPRNICIDGYLPQVNLLCLSHLCRSFPWFFSDLMSSLSSEVHWAFAPDKSVWVQRNVRAQLCLFMFSSIFKTKLLWTTLASTQQEPFHWLLWAQIQPLVLTHVLISCSKQLCCLANFYYAAQRVTPGLLTLLSSPLRDKFWKQLTWIFQFQVDGVWFHCAHSRQLW